MRGVRPLLTAMAVVLIVGTGSLLFLGGDATEEAPSDAVAITLPEGVTAATTDGAATEDPSTNTEQTNTTNADGVEISPAQGLVAGGDRQVVLPDDPLLGLAIEVISTELQQPTIAVAAPGDDRLFVTERVGRIKVIDGTGVQETSWMNISDRTFVNGIEPGLLGLAFHPQYETNGRFFVYYVNSNQARTLSEFQGTAAGGDPSSEKVLFSYPQPPDSVDIRHWGGMIQFGPDGYIYISSGDGADARGQGQNPDSIFAAILRIDVDSGDPYAIPDNNPFLDGGAPEVIAYGVRNPWRTWIDPFDNEMYIADVGQAESEEVNVIDLDVPPGGYNLGWANVEGSHCFFENPCDITDYVVPVLEYENGDAPDGGCSITGGPVYRGNAIPELDGHYFYADWCRGWIKSFLLVDGEVTNEVDWRSDLGEINQINGIGTDANGEMIVVTFDGQVLRIVPER